MQKYTPVWLSQAIQIRLCKDLWCAVESFRRNQPDIPTRPEAVRRLLHQALDLGGCASARLESDFTSTVISQTLQAT